MTDDHKYGPWIAFNGGPAPVADHLLVQVQTRDMSRADAEKNPPMTRWRWEIPQGVVGSIIAYRVLIEPETVTLWGMMEHTGGVWGRTNDGRDNLRLTYQTFHGKPDWSTARIEEITE